MPKQLQKLFAPKAVALIGASDKEGSVGHAIHANIVNSGFSGRYYPVNPSHKKIGDIPCHDSVTDINGPLDLAVISVPASIVEKVFDECIEKSITACIIVTAGFEEASEEGAEIQNRIAKKAGKHEIAVIGPNCLGVMNTDDAVSLNATFAGESAHKGGISFLTQSGAVGVYGLEFAHHQGMGFDCFVSIGNKVDIAENELIDYLSKRDSTRVIAAYLEDLKDAGLLRQVAGRAVKKEGKPLILLKAGGSPSGRRAAASHTGALTGSDEALDDVLDQMGILRVRDLRDLFNLADWFSMQKTSGGARLGIITNAGGPSIIATDHADRKDLNVPELSDKTRKKLDDFLPNEASTLNPVDLLGDADAGRFGKAVEVLVNSDDVDRLLVVATRQRNTNLIDIARTVSGVADKHSMPIACAIAAFNEDGVKVRKVLAEAGVPNFHFVTDAVDALAAGNRFSKISQSGDTYPDIQYDKSTVRKLIERARASGRTHISAPDSYGIFEACGMDVLKHAFADNRERAVELAKDFPDGMAISVVSDDILHKTGTGGVILDVESPHEAGRAWDRIMERVPKNKPDARIDGVQIQEILSGGPQMILGMQKDPDLGPLVMFGLGGSMVEVLNDVSFGMVPVSREYARQMINGIRSRDILEGKRGNPPSNVDSLERAILSVSQLVVDFPEIKSIDLNPLFALHEKAVLADARVILDH